MQQQKVAKTVYPIININHSSHTYTYLYTSIQLTQTYYILNILLYHSYITANCVESILALK